MNLGRKLARKGDLYAIDLEGSRVPVKKGDLSPGEKPIRVKSVDGWWQRKRAELAEAKRSPTTPTHPLDRRIARAIKKATGE